MPKKVKLKKQKFYIMTEAELNHAMYEASQQTITDYHLKISKAIEALRKAAVSKQVDAINVIRCGEIEKLQEEINRLHLEIAEKNYELQKLKANSEIKPA